MTHTATTPSKPSKLLADPAQVAAIRELIVHARQVGAVHATYSIGNGRRQSMTLREHTWDLGDTRVGYHNGALYYDRSGKTLLSGAGFDDAPKVADMLAAIGVLPPVFSTAYQLGRSDAAFITNTETRPDRTCRHCGATSGLKLVRGDVLELTPMQWQCWDDCQVVTR